MFGLRLFALSMWNFTPLTHDWGWRELLVPQALRGLAQQFAIAPTVTLTLAGLAAERLKLASGLFNLMRNLGGAIGIASVSTILNNRTNFHYLRLIERLNTTNAAMNDFLHRVGSSIAAETSGDAVHQMRRIATSRERRPSAAHLLSKFIGLPISRARCAVVQGKNDHIVVIGDICTVATFPRNYAAGIAAMEHYNRAS